MFFKQSTPKFSDSTYSPENSINLEDKNTRKVSEIWRSFSTYNFDKVNIFNKRKIGFIVNSQFQSVLDKFEIGIIVFEINSSKINEIRYSSNNLAHIINFEINKGNDLENWFNSILSNSWPEIINSSKASFSIDINNLKLIFDKEIRGKSTKITLLIQQKQINSNLLEVNSIGIAPIIPPSRNLLLDKIETSLNQLKTAQIASLALFFININRFQVVNDSLGYNIGDALLNKINTRLSQNIDENISVYHLSGDEFGMLYEDFEGQKDVEILAKKIITQFEKPFDIDGKNIYISISLGVAIANDEYLLSENLLGDAHRAMRKAKTEKFSGWKVFNSQMKTKAESRLQLEADLRVGIQNNEFKVFYQPIYDLQKNKISRCECLIRWQSPTRGIVSPEHFLALAEDTGLIIELDRIVFNRGLMQLKLWQKKKLPEFQLSFNLSALQLKQNDFVEFVLQTLNTHSFDPSRIEFEITENILIDDFQNSKSIISELQNNGISVAIDDFGTGYSSLSYLSNFNFQTLKIDKSFIQDITLEPNRQAIVKSIIELSRSMNINLIAEGVETLDQLEFLKNNGCHEIQGYLISKPLDEKSLNKFFKLSNFMPQPVDKN